MEVGLGVLRLSLADFWAMTLGEFQAALDGHLEAKGQRQATGEPPSRGELRELMARFPDPSSAAAALPPPTVD